jgi:hypothetical protein
MLRSRDPHFNGPTVYVEVTDRSRHAGPICSDCRRAAVLKFHLAVCRPCVNLRFVNTAASVVSYRLSPKCAAD